MPGETKYKIDIFRLTPAGGGKALCRMVQTPEKKKTLNIPLQNNPTKNGQKNRMMLLSCFFVPTRDYAL
jgi:hypothetical protein